MKKMAECVENEFTDEQLAEAKITREELALIRASYVARVDSLRSHAESIARLLQPVPSVHSIKYRVKDPNHLIEKVVRKRIEKPDRKITIDNYSEEITDLIGIRVLHLYKEDWKEVHSFITANWTLKAGESPTAYVRNGDNCDDVTDSCAVKNHDRGYRSIHYVIELQPTKEIVRAEIQVRSLFEEAWAEIDHQLAYPNHSSDPVLLQCLGIFNSIVGYADQMASFMRYLQLSLAAREVSASSAITVREAKLNEMSKKLDQLSAENERESKDKRALQDIVEGLREQLQDARNAAASSYRPGHQTSSLGVLGDPNSLAMLAKSMAEIGSIRSQLGLSDASRSLGSTLQAMNAAEEIMNQGGLNNAHSPAGRSLSEMGGIGSQFGLSGASRSLGSTLHAMNAAEEIMSQSGLNNAHSLAGRSLSEMGNNLGLPASSGAAESVLKSANKAEEMMRQMDYLNKINPHGL